MDRAPPLPWQSRPRRASALLGVAVALLVVGSTFAAALLLYAPSTLTPGRAAGSPGPSPPTGSGGGTPPVTPAAASPDLTVYPKSGPVGTVVTFNATGYADGSKFTIKDTYLNDTKPRTVCNGTTSSKGAYSCTYAIPPTGGGDDNFTGEDAKSNLFTTTYVVTSDLLLSPTTGLVGTSIAISGTGFGGKITTTTKGVASYWKYPVNVTYYPPGGGSELICSTETDSSANGTFACTSPFPIPAGAAGPHKFYAYTTNKTSLNGTSYFNITSGLSDGPTHGPVGTTVTFAGTGFGAGVPITVTWNTSHSKAPKTNMTKTACTTTSLNTGSFSCAYTIPFGTYGGEYNFSATDTQKDHSNASFTVTNLSVAPIGGPVNSSVVFSGLGFAPDSLVNMSWADGFACNGQNTTAAGLYTCDFRIPAFPAGDYLFNASDGQGDYATTYLTVEPLVELNRTWGDPGTAIRFTGTGFGRSVPLTVRWPSGVLLTGCSVTTTVDGNFSCNATIPLGTAGGTYTFTAEDSLSDASTVAFSVPLLSASPSAGPIGTAIAFTSTGFAPSSSITVASPKIGQICKGTTSAEGVYSTCSYSVGYVPAGVYNFTAKDVDGDTAWTLITVAPHLSTSPATTAHADASVTFSAAGFAADALVTVAWTSNRTTACTTTTAASGAGNCSVKLGWATAGTYAVSASDAYSDTASSSYTVIPLLNINDSVGPGGTPVAFAGSGFAANSSLSLTFSAGTVCTVETKANGTFACDYVIPYLESATYTFKAADAAGDSAVASFSITPLLNLSRPSAPVGTLLLISGAGFTPGKTANVTWTGGTSLACDATISASGGFSCTFAIPQDPTGHYTFTARDWNYPNGKVVGFTATAPFTLTPSLNVTPTAGVVGTVVTFFGLGYAAGTLVPVTWSLGTACSNTTGANGSFSCSYTIPDVSAGKHEFTAAPTAGISASVNFTVLTVLTLEPSAGAVGTTIALNGTGFPASTSVSVNWTGGTACTVTTTVAGTFACSKFVMPASPAGTYTFSAYVAGTSLASATFTVEPSLTVSPNAGPVGTPVAFHATGFGGGVAIAIASSLGAACNGVTGENGSFGCNYTIPSAAGGAYSFTASDASHHASASFTVGTILSVTPALGAVGTTLHFTGAGFAGSTSITISWSGGTVCTGTTGGSGGFQCNATMPAAPLGSHTFTGTAGASSASTSFTVRPALTSSPASGASGSSVRFTGTGFLASASVTVTWSGPTTCSTTTAVSGGFNCSLTIPLGTAGGVYLFTATDTSSDTATATFEVITGLAASPDHGPDQTTIEFLGTNFADSVAVGVSSSLGVACSSSSTTTGPAGGFDCNYTIPSATPGGTYNFTATDTKGNSASVLVFVTFLTAVPDGVLVGTVVNLSGGGFNANAAYTVNDPWGTACSGTSGPTGAFACSVTIPTSATPGQYNFTATDGTDVANAGFGVFSVSAPVPTAASVDVGQSVNYSVTASGGVASLSYSWSVLAALGCTPSTTSKIVCKPTAAVNASVTVTVKDQAGYTVASPALAYRVYSDPTQAPPVASPSTVDTGKPVTFTAKVAGGSGGGSYTWSASGLGCTASTGATLSCTPTTSGSYSVSYQWVDSNGFAATGTTTLSFTVNGLPTQAPATPSQPAADIGQTVTFTAKVTGGSGGGSYAWTYSGLACTATTGATLSCTPAAAGSFSVAYAWTDSDGVAATGTTTLPFTVSTDPSVTAPTANVSSADVGQSVSFKVTASGGTGSYTYDWLGLPAGCTGSGASFSCKPTAPVTGASITVKLNDSNGFIVVSTALAFTVYADPTVTAPAASASSADVGQTVSFNVTATGGSGTLTFTWSVPGALGCTASTTSKISCKPTGAGNLSVSVKVTDTNLFAVTSSTLTFPVYADPTEDPASPSTPSADVGQSVTFKAVVSGGSGGGAYTWTSTGLNCTATTGPTLTCTPPTAGAFKVVYQWTDSNGVAATPASISLAFTVNVNPAATVPSPSRSSADVGETITFSTVPSGGSGVYTYTWTVPSGLGCTATSAASISCQPTAKGNYTVSVYVTDTVGVRSPTVTSAVFEVFVSPSAGLPSPSRSSADIGQQLTFTTTASGGTGSYTYTWTVPAQLGCTVANSPLIECTPNTKGVYTVSVYVTDSDSVASAPVTSGNFTVYAVPAVSAPSPSHTSGDVGETITFTTTASGGFGTFTYTWTAPSGLGCSLQDAATITCVPTAKGNYTVTVSAMDGNGLTTVTETGANFQVYAAPSITALTPNHGSADVGEAITFSATTVGGFGAITFTWTAPTGLGCTATTHSTLSCVPLSAGTYTVNVTATDANGVVSPLVSHASYLVDSKPAITLVASSTSFLEGGSVTFTSTASGGSGSYVYNWSQVPIGCPTPKAPSFSCTPTSSGGYTVLVTVHDSNNGSANANVTINVQPSFLGLPATEGYAIVAGAVIAGVAALAVVLVIVTRKRRSKRQQLQF